MYLNILIISVLINILFFLFFKKITKFVNIKDVGDGKRKFQKKPVFLIGGTILITNLVIIYIFNYFFTENILFYKFLSNHREYFSIIFGSILFYIFGLYDDKIKLSANYKLLISLILVVFFILLDDNLLIKELNFSFLDHNVELRSFSYFFTILSFLLFINALNMLDGINLQAGFYCILIFLIFILKGIFVNLSLILIISLLFFLYLNFKNKAYLGESGTQLLAFIISYIFLKSNNYQEKVFFADEIFVIMALPGLDMFRLFLIRLISGKHPFKPDTKHIHHLLNAYFSKINTFLIILVGIFFSIVFYYLIGNKFVYIISYILSYIVLVSFLTIKKKTNKLKRIFDLIIGIILLFVLLIPFVIISILIKLNSSGPIFYISRRVGKNNQIFYMAKFRTMKNDTPQIHSNDLKNPNYYITSIGKTLRKYSLDELPQIIHVVSGKMSLVGPRPSLENQHLLIEKRNSLGIHRIKPGITGLAQVNGRDEVTLDEKIKFDYEYTKKQSLLLDLKILFKTISVVSQTKGLKH